jgi:hypothetical protein
MRELLADVDRWRSQGHRVALARVVDIDGSGPRLPGAAMARASPTSGSWASSSRVTRVRRVPQVKTSTRRRPATAAWAKRSTARA